MALAVLDGLAVIVLVKDTANCKIALAIESAPVTLRRSAASDDAKAPPGEAESQLLLPLLPPIE